METKKDIAIVNAPNNIAKGRIEIDAQINRLYYNILNNIQKENREFIIKAKKGQQLTEEQENILNKLDSISTLQCNISKEELEKVFKNNNYKTEDEIKLRFNSLQTAVFEFTTGEKSSRMTQLIGAVDINEDGYLVSLDAKLYKYLFYNLDVGYTPINLATLFNLQSQYAQTLYVLLRSWSGKKHLIEFSVDELREKFKVGSKYKSYADFKRRCIIQAIEEINRTGSMYIEKDIGESKKGRSVISVTFKVTDNEPRQVSSESLMRNVEPIEWIPGIMVENINLANVLDALYGDIKHGLAKEILFRAYLKTLEKDKNGDKLLTRRNRSFFTLIADEEIQKYQTEVMGEIVEDSYY